MIDLRSDTLTRPTDEMRSAMAAGCIRAIMHCQFMKIPRLVTFVSAFLLLSTVAVVAQNDKYDQQRKLLAGTWMFDVSFDSIAPDRKYTTGRNVTISLDGNRVKLEFQSEKGEKDTYFLNTDKSGETNKFIRNNSTDTINSITYWKKSNLVREFKQYCRACSDPWQRVTETYSVSDDGKMLTIIQESPSEIAKVTGQIGSETFTRRYRRLPQ